MRVCHRVRGGLALRSSNDSTGSSNPFTASEPSGRTRTNPSASRRVSADIKIVPGVASCSMRAARYVDWPTAE